jgi:hypothetical protein
VDPITKIPIGIKIDHLCFLFKNFIFQIFSNMTGISTTGIICCLIKS